MKKTVIVIGPTGGGKSTLVALYSQGSAPIIGHDIWSQTTETKGYNTLVDGEAVIMYDTPGLGDSEGRDQIFVDDFVRVLQVNNPGVHKFYFCMTVNEPRLNAFLKDCFAVMLQLAPMLKEKPSILTIVLTKADKGAEHYWQRDLDQKIAELKSLITEDYGIAVNVLVVGENNQQQFINDIKFIPMDIFCQTSFMKQVETLETQRKKANEALEVAKKNNEQNQEKLGKLQADLDASTKNHAAVEQQQQQEITNLKNQIASMNNQGGGGGGCALF